MKTLPFIFGLVIFGALSALHAQSINVTSTGVGIGTVIPAGKTEIFGGGLNLFLNQPSAADIYMRYHVPGVRWWTLGAKSNGDFWFSNSSTLTTDDSTPLVIKSGGNIGVGTSSPTQPLHVQVNNKGLNLVAGFRNMNGSEDGSNSVGVGFLNEVGGNWWKAAVVHTRTAGYGVGVLQFLVNNDATGPSPVTLSDARMTITSSGNVGIGTTNATHRLTVNGQVKSKGFITDTSNWSDYVFEPGYRLAPLAEVEAHIKEMKHLPGVPSEAELVKNGLDLGEMSKVQMAQIEQLMLHVIAQDKRLQAQEKRIAELEATRSAK